MTGLHLPKIEAVGDGIRPGTGSRLHSRAANLLSKVDLSFPALRSERGHVQTVVIENSKDHLELFVVKQLRNFVADQSSLLQFAHMRLKRHRLIPPKHVEPGHVESNPGADSCLALRRSRPRRLPGLEFQS